MLYPARKIQSTMNYILIDSQRLTALQQCPQLYQYKYELNKRTLGNKPHFEIGHIYHKMLKLHYTELKYRSRWHQSNFNYEKLIELDLKVGNHFAIRSNIEVEEIGKIETIWNEYSSYYENDPLLKYETVGTEIYFAKPCGEPFEFQDESYQVVCEGRIDWILRDGDRLIVVDHKHESSKRTFSAIRNQFLIYPWATGARLLIVNVIGTQTSLKPENKFYRVSFNYPNEVIEEFERDVIYYAKEYLKYKSINYFPRHHNSCDTYGICDFERVCFAPNDLRELRLDRDYGHFNWNVFEG